MEMPFSYNEAYCHGLHLQPQLGIFHDLPVVVLKCLRQFLSWQRYGMVGCLQLGFTLAELQ